MGLPALFGRHAADHVGPIGDGLLGVEGAGLAREALADDARVFVDPDLRALPSMVCLMASASMMASRCVRRARARAAIGRAQSERAADETFLSVSECARTPVSDLP